MFLLCPMMFRANVLPRYPSDIPVIIFKLDGKENKSKELRVCRKKVIDALFWLTGKNNKGEPNNPRYQDVTIDKTRFDSLPEDDFFKMPMNVEFESSENENSDEDEEINPDLGPYAEENDEKVYDCNTEMGSFISTKVNSRKEKDVLNDSVLKPETIKIGKDALNEFTTEYLAAMAFPTLFPDGKGDPTKFSTRRFISRSDTESFQKRLNI